MTALDDHAWLHAESALDDRHLPDKAPDRSESQADSQWGKVTLTLSSGYALAIG